MDGKKVLVIGARGPLEAALQYLFQRKGSMTMSSPWAAPQLQGKVGLTCNSAALKICIRKEERLAMCEVNTEQGIRERPWEILKEEDNESAVRGWSTPLTPALGRQRQADL